MDTSLDLLAWRASLADAEPAPSAALLGEWASRLAASEVEDGAALLADVAALYQGFSPQAEASRQSGDPSFSRPFGHRPLPASEHMMRRTLAELGELAGMLNKPADRAIPTAPPNSGAPVDVAESARALRHLLEQPWSPEDGAELAALLARLAGVERGLPTLDYRNFAPAPLTVLVPAIATVALLDFVLSMRDLWASPLGSPELLHRAARLDEAGLGPYLGNVDRLAPDSRSLIALARLAHDNGEQAGKRKLGLEQWIGLLSRGCGERLLLEIVDDLGDVAAHEALSVILERIASRHVMAFDPVVVTRVRDAALDNGDYALAARAQQAVVHFKADDRLENLILGEIEASGGHFARAARIFRHWLARSPNDPDLRKRLEAAEAERFDKFFIERGFGSPSARQVVRLHRRGVMSDTSRGRGERMHAVDVG